MVHIHPKPKNDREFLEVISQIIFIAGFRWDLVHAKWPKIRKAFNNFNIDCVASENAEALMKKEGMIKNSSKISAIIENARQCREIIKRHGSIKKWIEEIQKNNKKEPLFNPTVREEMQKFSRIGKTTGRWLAYVTTRDKKLLE